MNYIRFDDVIKNTTIINTFNSDNSNLANIKTHHQKIMTTIANTFLKFEPIIEKTNNGMNYILYYY